MQNSITACSRRFEPVCVCAQARELSEEREAKTSWRSRAEKAEAAATDATAQLRRFVAPRDLRPSEDVQAELVRLRASVRHCSHPKL
eukprot:COSAG04_NODE_1696_length_5900_cov_86.704706_3_plen_87_part_00